MSRRRPVPGPPPVPVFVRELQPDRYRHVAARYLERHPDETFWAAMAVWRAFLAERHRWMRSRDMPARVNGRPRFRTPLPPVHWVRETFGTPAARWPS